MHARAAREDVEQKAVLQELTITAIHWGGLHHAPADMAVLPLAAAAPAGLIPLWAARCALDVSNRYCRAILKVAVLPLPDSPVITTLCGTPSCCMATKASFTRPNTWGARVFMSRSALGMAANALAGRVLQVARGQATQDGREHTHDRHHEHPSWGPGT
jgi:hypothetical protein